MAFACFDAFALGGGIPYGHTTFQLLSDLLHEVRLEDDDVALPEPAPNYRDPPPLHHEPRPPASSWPGLNDAMVDSVLDSIPLNFASGRGGVDLFSTASQSRTPVTLVGELIGEETTSSPPRPNQPVFF
ncbi:hypothetical protein HDU97_009432 [Phlyctochytrium planicorne]|nr:hypothetical protein HDU97_009432 [Phlyctochytrium planicorne]